MRGDMSMSQGWDEPSLLFDYERELCFLISFLHCRIATLWVNFMKCMAAKTPHLQGSKKEAAIHSSQKCLRSQVYLFNKNRVWQRKGTLVLSIYSNHIDYFLQRKREIFCQGCCSYTKHGRGVYVYVIIKYQTFVEVDAYRQFLRF